MPFIDAKLSIKLDENQKNDLQEVLANAVSTAFIKPKSYIMTNIEDSKSLYMGGNEVKNGAYIAVYSLGTNISKSACQSASQTICSYLTSKYGFNGANIYITYHPVELWSWNGSMF